MLLRPTAENMHAVEVPGRRPTDLLPTTPGLIGQPVPLVVSGALEIHRVPRALGMSMESATSRSSARRSRTGSETCDGESMQGAFRARAGSAGEKGREDPRHMGLEDMPDIHWGGPWVGQCVFHPDAHGPSYAGVGPSYGGVRTLNPCGFEGPRPVWSVWAEMECIGRTNKGPQNPNVQRRGLASALALLERPPRMSV